ncbi:hypothetical protein Dimus_029890 [Dionaea muscipula]
MRAEGIEFRDHGSRVGGSGVLDFLVQGRDDNEGGKMIDDQDLGFFANFLGIFIFVLVIAYHFVMADPKYEGS